MGFGYGIVRPVISNTPEAMGNGALPKKRGALYCPLTHRKPKTKPMKKLPFLCDPSFQQYDISHEGFTYRGF
jgi:hypothetical protein